MSASQNDSGRLVPLDATSCVAVASFAILYYDYFVTLEMEVERFWMLKTTWASFFFYMNRYLSILGFVPIIFTYFWATHDLKVKTPAVLVFSLEPSGLVIEYCQLYSCNSLQYYHTYHALILQVVIAGMLIMRLYAFYNRDVRVLVFLISVAVGAVIFGCWAIISSKGTTVANYDLTKLGCNQSLTQNQAVRFALSWTGLLVFDVVVFVMTLYKSIRLGRTGSRSVLYNIILRDGSLYFGVMVLSNVFNITTILEGTPELKGIATTMMNALSSTMISRVMFNLRDPAVGESLSRGRFTTSSTRARSGAPIISTVMDPNQSAYDRSVINDEHLWASESIELERRSNNQAADY